MGVGDGSQHSVIIGHILTVQNNQQNQHRPLACAANTWKVNNMEIK